jgi:hypothetical protein
MHGSTSATDFLDKDDGDAVYECIDDALAEVSAS